jgi:hypothetical protein
MSGKATNRDLRTLTDATLPRPSYPLSDGVYSEGTHPLAAK